MRPSERDAAYLLDMVGAGRSVVRFVEGRTLEQYLGDELLRAGIERKIEIIGEAARGVSRAFQDSHPQVPWQKIVAQRHVLAHEYGAIRHADLWRVATVHVPAMIESIEGLLPPTPTA